MLEDYCENQMTQFMWLACNLGKNKNKFSLSLIFFVYISLMTSEEENLLPSAKQIVCTNYYFKECSYMMPLHMNKRNIFLNNGILNKV